MTVVGIRRVDMDRDGRSYHGNKYFVTDTEDNVDGVTTDSFFASDYLLSSLKKAITLGDEIVPVYKRESRTLRTIVFL